MTYATPRFSTVEQIERAIRHRGKWRGMHRVAVLRAASSALDNIRKFKGIDNDKYYALKVKLVKLVDEEICRP